MDDAMRRILDGGLWYGATPSEATAWRLGCSDDGGSPSLIATRDSDGLVLPVSDRDGLLVGPFLCDDDAGEAVQWVEDLLQALDDADAIPVEAAGGIDVADIRTIADELHPPFLGSDAPGHWKMVRRRQP